MGIARQAGAAAICAALVSTAACSSGTSKGASHTDGTIAPTPTSYSAATQQRQRMSIAYAQQLTGRGPHLTGETRLTSVPKRLAKPGQTIGVNNLVVRAQYWSVSGTPDQLYAALKKAPTDHLTLTGYGRPSAGPNPSNLADLDYETDTEIPAYLESSDLYVEILGISPGHSDIAAFAEVVPHPVRQAAETIPAGDSKVTVTRIRVDRPAGPIRTVALDSVQSQALVRAFDIAPISAPGQCIGGIGPAYSYRVEIVSATRTWKLGYNGVAACDAISVISGKTELASLEYSPSLLRLMAAGYLRGNGFIDGGLGATGGPYGGDVGKFYRGAVQAVMDGRVVARGVAQGQNGSFELEVPPGRYTVTGRSPHYDDGHGVCRGYKPVNVKADQTAYMNLLCQLK